MKIIVYGHPYHSLDYYLYDSKSLQHLFETYNVFDSFLNMREALNYIDGAFAIQILLEDEEIWITDYYGYFPIFYNPIEKRIITKFDNEQNLIVNNSYMKLCKQNIDTKYHSNIPSKNTNDEHYLNIIKIKNNIQKYLISPFINWIVAKPAHIYYLKTEKKIRYVPQKNFYKNTNENIFIECISKISKNKKVLTSLSAGYDSRAIFSVALKYVENLHRYTYGIEKEFVDSNFEQPNVIEKQFDYDYETMINQNILRMNGMGDMYYKAHNFFIQPFFEKYDMLFTGDGANEYLFFHPKLILYKYIYATGDGHHYKTQAEKIITIPPYSQKRIINNYVNKKLRYNIERQIFSKNIIEKTNYSFLKIPFFTADTLTNNVSSNFGHIFDFNTKEKYLTRYYQSMIK